MLRILLRCYSKDLSITNSSRRELFDKEFLRQLQSNKRNLEKITVEYHAPAEKVTLSMNKNISTPMDCARHIQEVLANRSILAFVNGRPHDMNKPLTENCSVTFVNFRSNEAIHANTIFWRSCSFLTNWVLENCFHEDFKMNICSFPSPDPRSGSFVCDIQLLYRGDVSFDPAIIKDIDLSALSSSARRIAYTPYEFQSLSVSGDIAKEIFSHCPLKLKQIPLIIERQRQIHNNDRINLYKVGDFVDICQGPLIPSTSHIGLFKLTTIYPIETKDYGRLYRVQGLAIPNQLPTLHTTFDILTKRASFPNKHAPLPQLKSSVINKAVDAQ